MNRARLLFVASALCMLAPACDSGRAERARLEAEMMEREAMAAYLRQEARELQDAQIAKAKADIAALQDALLQYALLNGGEYPDDLAELAIADVNGQSFLGQTTVPTDPWGNAYVYEHPRDIQSTGLIGSPSPNVWCFGEDGVVGGEGLAADIGRGVSFIPWTMGEPK